jgi:hypothetical protein
MVLDQDYAGMKLDFSSNFQHLFSAVTTDVWSRLVTQNKHIQRALLGELAEGGALSF